MSETAAEIDTGGNAFPESYRNGELVTDGGMTLRAYLAAHAMVGLLSAPWHPDMGCDYRVPPAEIARHSVRLADELIAALKVGK